MRTPAGRDAGQPPDDIATLMFIGTATTLLQLGAFTLLTDPDFRHRGQRAHLGYGLSSRRLTEPAAQPADLPALDAVLLSHLHGDNLDRVARRGLARGLPIITTPQAAQRLQSRGFGDARGLPTWSTRELQRPGERLRITSVPGTHGPTALRRMLPDVMGSVVEWERDNVTLLRFYITGDTIFRDDLRTVPEHFPNLDAMVIHLGGTRVSRVPLTMDARQGADLVELVRPPLTVPIHYDDYTVFRSPLRDFLTEVRRRGLPGEVREVIPGDTVTLPVRTARPPPGRR